jgi:hypothetical protein
MEMNVALALAGLVLAGIASFSLFTLRSFVALGNYSDLDRASRNALDLMTRDIRQARAVTSYRTNKLMLTAQVNSALVFEYNPSAATLTRTSGGAGSVLLTQCDFLSFAIYQRKPMSGLQFYPATNLSGGADPTVAKLVDVSWRCSRTILALKVNTESVQTAKIVIRN